ncbi:MAG: hypothetical protein KatS3mg101_0234 [Patescibacteria group bacterium]|nr:MAG: hypothetical protein KatS3mg101_0234 [Patescibacteria group bacterium]
MTGRYYTLILIALVILAAYVGGIKTLYVKSDSMEPYIRKGDIVIVIPARRLKIGDIAAFKKNNTYITHRIVEIRNDLFITKGDNNQNEDPYPIVQKEIVGKAVFSLPTHYIIKASGLPLLYWCAGFGIGIVFHQLTIQKVVRV